jgi:micrococcal nuclease
MIQQSRKIHAIFIILFLLAFVKNPANKILLSAAEFPISSGALPTAAVVTAVYDGDTVKVKFENGISKRIRLLGVDAPEMNDPREKMKFWAHMAKRLSFFYLYRKEINLSYDSEIEDKYGRILAYVWTKEKGLFNDFILRQGFAFAFLNFPLKKDYAIRLKEAEREAQKSQKGIWRRRDFPSLRAQEAKHHLGEVLSVKYTCSKVEAKRNFFILHSGENFQALIPMENIVSFPDPRSFQGKVLSVIGFIEDYKGRTQIVIFLPQQIKIIDHSK